MTDETMSGFFEVDDEMELPAEIPLTEVKHFPDVSTNVIDDYSTARTSLKHLIEKGERALDNMVKVANESESPRAFEVLGNYLKTITDMNRSLMELNKDVKDITQEKSPENVQNTQNNYIYSGNTEDLQEFLKEQDKNLPPILKPQNA